MGLETGCPFCSFLIDDSHHLSGKGEREESQAIGTKKQAGMAILISDKIDVTLKPARKGTFKLIKYF